ncbi:MAG: biotin--[acetyl-CoA-carboxylase] ligase [Eubacteriales bacterium]|nr:biotin--[acetyl-CoA-carboxylase] ligase [Eubacteriales bacterium]
MNIDIIRRRLDTRRDRQIEYYPELPSTNTFLMRLASRDSSALLYTAVIAGTQTAGRGRFTRSFYSPGGGLYISVLLPCPPGNNNLTLAAGVAAAEAIEETAGIPIRLKWVNDLICGGKKIGGILCESSADTAGVRYAVCGIGINLARVTFTGDIADTAISVEAMGGQTQPEELAAALLNRIDAHTENPEGVLTLYRKRMAYTGEHIAFAGAQKGEGTVLGIDDDGRLLVRTGAGITALNAGEITLKRQ